MKLNHAETKVMIVNGEGPVMIEEEPFEDVWKFTYLGSMIPLTAYLKIKSTSDYPLQQEPFLISATFGIPRKSLSY